METKKTIYVIEDDRDLADNIKEYLELLDYDVQLNHGEKINVQEFRAFAPVLFLVDWILPNREGIDIIHDIKNDANLNNTPCVLLSGKKHSETDRIIGYQSGIDAYLIKPFSMQMLVAVIKNIEVRTKNSVAVKPEWSNEAPIENVFLSEFRMIVQQEFANPKLNLDEIAERMKCSKATLINRIKLLTGKTPYEILKNYRLDQARKLILKKNGYISDISRRSGYTNLAVFSKAFKQQFGYSPKQLYLKSIK